MNSVNGPEFQVKVPVGLMQCSLPLLVVGREGPSQLVRSWLRETKLNRSSVKLLSSHDEILCLKISEGVV